VRLKNVVWILFFILAPLCQAKAGSASSGGGKAVVCRDLNGRIQSAEVLDLFEGRITYGLEIKSFGATADANIKAMQEKIGNIFDGFLSFDPDNNLFTKAVHDFHLLPLGIPLKPVNDADEDVLPPKGCDLEQLAYYRDDQILLVNQEIWNALDTLNRAALFTHEVIYRQERSLSNATNSRRARKVVAHLFSDFVFTPVMQGVPKDAKECRTFLNDDPHKNTAFDFFLFPNPDGAGGQIAQFGLIRNNLVYSQTRDRISEWPDNPVKAVPINLKSSIDPEAVVNLARAYSARGEPRYYFFPEPEGRHVIHCNERPGNEKSEIALVVEPGSPIVITADSSYPTPTGKVTVKAPWFAHKFSIATRKTITVTGFKEVIISPDGAQVLSIDLPMQPVEVRRKYKTKPFYAGGLPIPQTAGYGYQVEVFATGWIGPKDRPGKPLNLKTRFRTQ